MAEGGRTRHLIRSNITVRLLLRPVARTARLERTLWCVREVACSFELLARWDIAVGERVEVLSAARDACQPE